MSRRVWIPGALVFVAAASLAPTAVVAQERPAAQRVTLDFHRAPLIEVVQFFSNLTRENYIIGGDLDAAKPLTVLSPRPVSVAEAREVLAVALRDNGLALVRAGAFWKIVKAADAGGEVIGPEGPASDPGTDTRLLRLSHGDAGAIAGVLDKIAGPSARVVVYAPANALLIIATQDDFDRLAAVVRALDRPEAERGIHVLQLDHARAEDVAEVLQGVVPPPSR